MRIIRSLVSIILVVVAGAVVHLFGWPGQWPDTWLRGADGSGDGRPTRAVSVSSLPRYTRSVASKAWFRRYFTRMVFADAEGPGTHTGILARWDRRRVRIDILNSGGPGMQRYVVTLARRLNRIQEAVRFVVVDGKAEITIEYLSHGDYRRTIPGTDSVGNCATRYYVGPPGLISADIKIDLDAGGPRAQRRATVIHELTHALGFNGHFRGRSYERRSVLYYASSVTNWSQNDAAAIRILYSSSVRSGMDVKDVNRALRRL
jgi:hypothetical protein